MAIVRGIGAFIVGYLVIAITVMGLFTAMWVGMKQDGSLIKNSWNVTPTWASLGVVVGVVAALLGGLVCRLIAGSMTAVGVLAVFVLLFGVLLAATYDPPTHPEFPEGAPADTSMVDAMTYAIQPNWALWSNPVIGCVGTLIGGVLIRRRKN